MRNVLVAKKLIICCVAPLILGFLNLNAQNFKERIYASYISGDMTDWALVIEEMKKQNPARDDIEALYDLSIAQYGYIGFCVIKEMKSEARHALNDVEENTKILLEFKNDWPQVHALIGALCGLKVGIDPYKVIFYGKKALTYNEIAMKFGPEDSHVWMEKGNLEFYKPDLFGKDIPYAIEAYNKSVNLFERSSEQLDYNWLYLNTLISLAAAYTKNEMYRKADVVYRKILRIEPNIIWIRDKEYPNFKKKHIPVQ